MTADELHAAVLAALSAASNALADSTGGPWHIGDAVDPTTPCNLHSAQDGRSVADGLSWQDAHVLAGLRNTAASIYRGVRRIVERHAPQVYGDAFRVSYCAWCDSAAAWPCDDYLDAAGAIPGLPEEVARALRR